MSSFIFNSFKKRYLNGEVPTNDKWTFIPVSEDFKNRYEHDDVKLEMYRSLSDFNRVSPETFKYECSAQSPYIKGKVQTVSVNDPSFKLKGTGLIEGYTINYIWKKSQNTIEKPLFVDSSNSANFYTNFNENVSGNNYINSYINAGGFYYIRSYGQYKWFADRSSKNNNLIGVFGNDLSAVITDPVGVEENKPFEGILDGNYHKFHLMIKGKHTDNGLVGVLGKRGIVRNFKIKGTSFNNSIECDKQITLEHIKKDGRDINCGMLVGRNYGRIENIDAGAMGEFKLYAFVPSVYSVTNKADKYKWNEWKNPVREKYDGNNDNFFYLNSFCINSPANICPYVGYFNEGKFAEGFEGVIAETNGYAYVDTNNTAYFTKYFLNNNDDKTFTYDVSHFTYNIMGNFFADNVNDSLLLTSYNYHVLRHIDVPGSNNVASDDYKKLQTILTTNPYYYGLDSFGKFTVRDFGNLNNSATWTVQYNSNLIDKAFDNKLYSNTSWQPGYEVTRNSLRLHPNARAAFNVGTIAGANYGTIQSVQVSTTVKNTSNFVGFIGGIAGKQADGNINNVTVYMDNQFTYDFGSNNKYGDVVYMKQTPILPGAVQNVVESVTSISQNVKDQIIEDYFKPWYEEKAKYSNRKKVNTAANVTDDVMAYKLRPIFVVGGLFGRFSPNTHDCQVNNCTVLYKDNYNSTKNSNYKRPENSFGVLVGKVDYSTLSYGVDVGYRMYCNNCKFSALTTVGEPYTYFDNYWDGTYWAPITRTITEGDKEKYSLVSGTISSRFVGTYELKNNVFDPVTYMANSTDTKLYNKITTECQTKPLTDFGIYYANDYPINMSAHNGGIIRTHILWNKIDQNAAGATVTTPAGDHWDFNHLYYEEPNYSPSLTNQGYNKRNMASMIISLNNCFSNIQRYIDVYDDYINQWKYMTLPPAAGTGETSGGISASELTSNKFSLSAIEFIKHYWTDTRSNSNASVNSTSISANLHWPTETTALPSWNSVAGFFHGGLIPQQTHAQIRHGTENAFDGYTTVNFSRNGYYDTNERPYEGPAYLDTPNYMNVASGAGDSGTAMSASETNCFIKSTSSYTFGRTYKKNIMKYANPNWSTTQGYNISYEQRVTFPSRNIKDKYSSYQYYTTSSSPFDYKELKPLYQVYGYTLPVHYIGNSYSMGYATDITDEEKRYDYVDYNINVGQYMPPIGIANKLEETTYVTVTSISSINKYGGLLVVDSSGRTVMFFDNDNGNELTGNTISYPTESIMFDNKIYKNILKVQ